jgi:hypothetical protein
MPTAPGKTFSGTFTNYFEGTSKVGAGAGAGSGALPQEVSEKPASAAIRPRIVVIFIIFFCLLFWLERL